MLSGTYGPWYLQGRQFGLYLVSQRLLGKLYSFLLLFVALTYADLIAIYVFMKLLYVYLITLYFFSLSIFSLFSSLLALPTEVTPLNNSQM